MFRFANPEYLYALVLIPALMIFYWYSRRQRRRSLAKFGQREILSVLMPNASNARPAVKFIVLLFALTSIIVGLARPQFGSQLKTVKREGIELIIALDVSNSMLAEDIQPNRLERAKRALSQLVDKLSDDKIGLIVFAGEAYTQLPITSDYVSAKLFLNSISPQIVPTQGTAIGAAIDLAVKSFTPQFVGNKVVIVITDGENHEDDANGAASSAAEQGIVIHTIGMGLPQGALIPDLSNGQRGYKKDHRGNTIVTKLNEPMLQQIAQAGKGTYIRANNSQVGLNTLLNEIDNMEKTEMESQIYADYDEKFQYFIGLGLLLLLLDFVILERKNKYLKNIKLFGDIK
ncbi:MAG TPA: VWA domain-containing protein [Prolixibacteraceae bacterium]|nr:VWA domain-containing protein [Prolixibacteraceae bacterium]